MMIEERIRTALKSLYGPVERALRKPRTSIELCAMIDDNPFRTMQIVRDMMRVGLVVECNGRYMMAGLR